MTIEIRIISTPDILVANDVFNLRQVQGHNCRGLSASSFLLAGESRSSLNGVLDFVCNLVCKKMPENEIWFFVGNSAWQPNTRIVNYRGLWGALKFRGLEVLGGSDAQESILEADGKIKFFGAMRLSAQSAESVVGALFSEQCSYILVLPKNFEVRHALDMGWCGDVAEDLNFFNYICENRGLVLKKVGEFDDCEWGVLAIGSLEMMKVLLR